MAFICSFWTKPTFYLNKQEVKLFAVLCPQRFAVVLVTQTLRPVTDEAQTCIKE